MTAAQRKAKAKKTKAAAKKKAAAAAGAAVPAPGEEDAEGGDDDDAEDSVAASASTSAAAAASTTVSPSASLICYNHLPCEYQHGMLALLALWGAGSSSAASASASAAAASAPAPAAASDAAVPGHMLLVGLGGGSLASFLSRALPRLELDVVELEPHVLTYAGRYFGFETHGRIRCHVADGMVFVKQLARRVAEAEASAEASADKSDAVGLAAQAGSLSLGTPSTPSPPSPATPSVRQDVIILDVNNIDLAGMRSAVQCCDAASSWRGVAVRVNVPCCCSPARALLCRALSDPMRHDAIDRSASEPAAAAAIDQRRSARHARQRSRSATRSRG
jgi:hypothetical protein